MAFQNATIAFIRNDVNGDGFLNKPETMRAISLLSDLNGEFAKTFDPNSEELAARLTQGMDNGVGKINLKEFKARVLSELSSGRNVIKNKFAKFQKVFREIVLDERLKVKTKIEGNSKWLVNPNSVFYTIWSLIVGLAALTLIFTLPLNIGWGEHHPFFETNIIFEFLFAVDFVLSWFTGFIDDEGVVIMDGPRARSHYLYSYALVDIISSFPANVIFALFDGIRFRRQFLVLRSALKSLAILRVAKALHLRRSSPLFKAVDNFSFYLETKFRITTPILLIRLFRLAFLTFVLGHWMGSLQFLVARVYEFPSDSWVVFAGLEYEPWHVQWRWALFKAMAQLVHLGFESPPFTSTSCDTFSSWCQKEHWMTLLCLFIGAVYHAFLISSMLAIIQANSIASTSFAEKMRELNDYMMQRDLPLPLRRQIREHFHLNYSSQMFFDESEVVKSMSEHQVRAVRRHCAKDMCELVPMLSDPEHKGFAHCLTSYLVEVRVSDGQVIFGEHELGDAMFFLHSGLVMLSSTSCLFVDKYDARPTLISEGCFFGEVSLLKGIPRTMTATAHTNCKLFRLDKDSFNEILRHFPDAAARLHRIADRRLRVWEHFCDPAKPFFPADAYDVDSEDVETVTFRKTIKVAVVIDAGVVSPTDAEETAEEEILDASSPRYNNTGCGVCCLYKS